AARPTRLSAPPSGRDGAGKSVSDRFRSALAVSSPAARLAAHLAGSDQGRKCHSLLLNHPPAVASDFFRMPSQEASLAAPPAPQPPESQPPSPTPTGEVRMRRLSEELRL